MALRALFDRVGSSLLGRDAETEGDAAEKKLVADTTELVVETVDPRLRLKTGYADKLEAPVRRTIAYLRAIALTPLEPLPLVKVDWITNPRLNAFFASADDVPGFLGRSKELREFFRIPSHREEGEAYALMAMKREERTVLMNRQEGERVQREVPQVTVSFSGHRLVAPSASIVETRLEIGRRIVGRLSQLALKRIVDLDMQASELGERKAWLAARLRLVKLAVDGAAGLLEDTAATRAQIAALERELRETVREFIQTKASVSTLDSYIRHIEAVFGHPEQHVALRQIPMRLNRMGIRVDGDSCPANAFSLTELLIGDGTTVTIAIVRCPLGELPPEENLLEHAERYL